MKGYVKFIESFQGESEIALDIIMSMNTSSNYSDIIEKQYQFNKRFYGMK
jgi:hypothetical protein